MMTDDDIKELKERYPLFEIERCGMDMALVHFSDTSGLYVGADWSQSIYHLDTEHRIKEIRMAWTAKYPGLIFYISQDTLMPVSAWINRNGRDGEGIGGSEEYLMSHLDEINAEAIKANQDGWFYCTRCNKAYPREQYGYYWFSETRCKSCCDADKSWLRSAQSESYN
jgi:hypothetical protein